MEELWGRSPLFEEDDQPAVSVWLNALPRLRHSLNINLPLPLVGQWLNVSETINVYSEPDFLSEVIESVWRVVPLGWGSGDFELLEIGEEVVFDGIRSHWAYVRLWSSTALETGPTNTFGWVFLGLLIY